MYRGMRVAVTVPYLDEAPFIAQVLRNIPSFVDLVVAVDDGSTDGGGKVASTVCDPRIVHIRNRRNMGVGGAVMRGHLVASKMGADVLAVMGGDGQMDGAFLPLLLDKLADGFDYAKGNRLKDGKGMPPLRFVGNRILTILTEFASGNWSVGDPQNGYTALKASALSKIEVGKVARRYQFENDMIIRLSATGAKIADIPMPPKYGPEVSGIKLVPFMLYTSAFLIHRMLWRLWGSLK